MREECFFRCTPKLPFGKLVAIDMLYIDSPRIKLLLAGQDRYQGSPRGDESFDTSLFPQKHNLSPLNIGVQA